MRFKGKKPIANYKDTWDLQTTLSPIIAEGLGKFLGTIKSTDYGGYPCDFDTPEDWYEVLEKMIFSFDAITKGLEEEPSGMTFIRKGKVSLKMSPEDKTIWDEYLVRQEELDKKIQEGLDLFAKYYRNLWW